MLICANAEGVHDQRKVRDPCVIEECVTDSFFLRFRFGDRKEILRDRLEKFERPFSIDVISGHYILRDRLEEFERPFWSLKTP